MARRLKSVCVLSICITANFVDTVSNCVHAGDCYVYGFEIFPGRDTVTNMTLKDGSICTGGLNSNVTSIQILQPAQHGTAAVSPQRFGYRADKHYVGKDMFKVRIKAQGVSNPQLHYDTDLTVYVDITP